MTVLKNKLRSCRKERGDTQASFAEELGVSRQTINAIENEKYNPSLELAIKISRLIGEPVQEIFYLPKDG